MMAPATVNADRLKRAAKPMKAPTSVSWAKMPANCSGLSGKGGTLPETTGATIAVMASAAPKRMRMGT